MRQLSSLFLLIVSVYCVCFEVKQDFQISFFLPLHLFTPFFRDFVMEIGSRF